MANSLKDVHFAIRASSAWWAGSDARLISHGLAIALSLATLGAFAKLPTAE